VSLSLEKLTQLSGRAEVSKFSNQHDTPAVVARVRL
jgi:hypothetical protein